MRSNLAEALMDLAGGGPPQRTTILPEAAVERLWGVFANYTAPNPYKPGDLVTPLADAPCKGAGEPHIVIEVLETPLRWWCGMEPSDTGSAFFGQNLDVRVANIRCGGGQEAAGLAWLEHGALEPYTGPGVDR